MDESFNLLNHDFHSLQKLIWHKAECRPFTLSPKESDRPADSERTDIVVHERVGNCHL